MSPAKKRRQMPTLINRGLGLLEVVMPQGSIEEIESVLPPGGERDSNGFWLPSGYNNPEELFSSTQRKMQQNQRRIQRRRLKAKAPSASRPPKR